MFGNSRCSDWKPRLDAVQSKQLAPFLFGITMATESIKTFLKTLSVLYAALSEVKCTFMLYPTSTFERILLCSLNLASVVNIRFTLRV